MNSSAVTMGEVEQFNDDAELAAGVGITLYLVIAWGVTSYVAFTRAQRGEMIMPDYDRCLAMMRRFTLGCTEGCNPRTCCFPEEKRAQRTGGSAPKASRPLTKEEKEKLEERKTNALLDEAMAKAREIVTSAVEVEQQDMTMQQHLMIALGEGESSDDEEGHVDMVEKDDKAQEIEAKTPKRYVLAGTEDVALKRKWHHPFDDRDEAEVQAAAREQGIFGTYTPVWLHRALSSWVFTALKLCFEGYFFVAPSFSRPIRWNRSRPSAFLTTSVYALGIGLAFFDPRNILGIATDTGDSCTQRVPGEENTSEECLQALSAASLWKVTYWVVIVTVYSPLLGLIGSLPWGVGPKRIHLFGRTSKWGKIGRGRLPLTLLVWLVRLLLFPLLVPLLCVYAVHQVDPTMLFKTLYAYFISTMYGALACRYQSMENPDTPAYLVADPGVTCWNNDLHWAAAGLAIPAIPLYVLLGHQNALKALGGVDFEEPSSDHEKSGLKGAGVPQFKLFKRALFFDSNWAELMINGKMLLSTVVAFLGPSGREDITWVMIWAIFLVNFGLSLAHLYMWPCTLDWINVLQQTIFAVATWCSVMAMTAHHMNEPESQGPNAGLYAGIGVIVLVGLYMVPKARRVSEHESSVAGNMLYAMERRAKNMKRKRAVTLEKKRIRGLQAGWTQGVKKLLGGLATLGGLFRSRYTKARNQIKDEIGQVQGRYFTEALANLGQVEANLKVQEQVVVNLAKHWHTRYKAQLRAGTGWDRARYHLKMMFAWERKLTSACLVAVQDALLVCVSVESKAKRKGARERRREAQLAKEAKEEAKLEKLMEVAAKMEEEFSVNYESHQLLTARRSALTQQMETEVGELLQRDRKLQEDHKAGRAFETMEEAKKRAAAEKQKAEVDGYLAAIVGTPPSDAKKGKRGK